VTHDPDLQQFVRKVTAKRQYQYDITQISQSQWVEKYRIKGRIHRHPERIDAMLSLLSVSGNLEWIADGAVNTAKDVSYTVRGQECPVGVPALAG
jgi:phosphate uptake regulator